MIITRWQAQSQPNTQVLSQILATEGIEPVQEIFPAQKKVRDHRHTMAEIRYVLKGELLFNISGNQFLLRAGDRVEIPANTRHSYSNNSQEDCISLCGYRIV